MPAYQLSLSASVILQAIANGYHYGFDIMDTTGLPSGTVYPALRRMEEAALIDSEWEAAEAARREQRPPRKYYGLTKAGRHALSEAAVRYRLQQQPAPGTKPAFKRS
jgi:PadR family transcriptional regulator, regulatory protein PadR